MLQLVILLMMCIYSRIDLPVVNDKETIMEVGQMYMWNYAGLPTTDGQTDAGACPVARAT